MAWLQRLSWLMGIDPSSAPSRTVVVVGLAGCGKTTFMQQLKPREANMNSLPPTIPGVAANAEQFASSAIRFVAFDLHDPQDGFGNPWESFYRDCHGIIFLVDSSDRLTVPHARSQLGRLLEDPFLLSHKIPILFLANKSDQGSAMPSLQIASQLGLSASVVKRPWSIYSTDSLTGEGFNEALDWLALQLKNIR